MKTPRGETLRRRPEESTEQQESIAKFSCSNLININLVINNMRNVNFSYTLETRGKSNQAKANQIQFFLTEPLFVNVYGAPESIPPAYAAWRAGTTNRAGNRFLGS
jgi:hypothetical protein